MAAILATEKRHSLRPARVPWQATDTFHSGCSFRGASRICAGEIPDNETEDVEMQSVISFGAVAKW